MCQCLEIIANRVPRSVAHRQIQPNRQVNKAFVFSEGARNCKDFSVANLTGAGKAHCVQRSQVLQATVSALPNRENQIVDVAIPKH
jgi:hypothetical protein